MIVFQRPFTEIFTQKSKLITEAIVRGELNDFVGLIRFYSRNARVKRQSTAARNLTLYSIYMLEYTFIISLKVILLKAVTPFLSFHSVLTFQ